MMGGTRIGALGAVLLLALWGCGEPEVEEILEFDFVEDLSRYDSVRVLLLDADDTGKVLEVAFAGKLESGGKLPPYALRTADGRDFVLRVLGYEADLVAYRNDVRREGSSLTAQVFPDTALPGSPPVLAGLQASSGELHPPFHRDTLAYTIRLPHQDSVLALTPSIPAMVGGLELQGVAVVSGRPVESIPLPVGKTLIEAKVVSQAGETRTYLITIERARGERSNLATLKTLVVSAGNLVPAFHKDTLAYRVFAAEGASWARITALAEDDSASVEVPPGKSAKGAVQADVALRAGSQTVSVKVVAENPSESRTYRILVTLPPNSLEAP